MAATLLQARDESTRWHFMMLLAASLAVVVVMSLLLIDSASPGAVGLRAQHLLLVWLIVGGIGAAGAIAWRTSQSAAAVLERSREEAAILRRHLATSEAVIKAEPQVLIYWAEGQGLRIIANSLATVAGLPRSEPELLRFGRWLEPVSADDLKQGLDRLFADARPFNILIKTTAGGYLEADGRAAGARAVLRLRDVAGHKRDLVRILDQHRQLERDIRSSRALLDALPMPVWLRGPTGRIEWINQAYVKAVDATDEAQVRSRQIELLESHQRYELDRLSSTSVRRIDEQQSGQVGSQRLPLIVGGERRTHNVLVLPMDGATAAAAIDVTALERAELELARLSAANDQTLNRVATGVAIFSRDQKLTFFNDAYRSLWQFDGAWLESAPSDGEILDRLRENSQLPAIVDYRPWKAKLLAVYKTGAEFEDWWHLPDGRTIHIVAEQRNDGGVSYLFDDETERFALESRYNALIDVQRETLDSLNEGVAVFGTDGRLKLFNSSFVQIWKLSRRMLAEMPHIDEIIRHASSLYDDPRIWLRITQAATALPDERAPIDGQMERPDQSVVDFAVTPLPDGATLVTFADVTDAKQYERALLERNEALIAADRLKSQFISHVSYELRTPLTNIIGFSELLGTPRTGLLNDKQREYLGDISGSSKTLLSIIDDILDLATIDAGGLELKLGNVDVRAVIDAAILGIRDRAGRARLTIDIAIADDAQAFVGDESRVRQVLYNLLSNAVGFSRMDDTIHLSCWREDRMVTFTIEDQGVGIPKEQQARIFQRFESQSHGSKHRGVGLGLSVVKSLVELHGGDMSLNSEPGRGTRITVRFPERGVRLEAVPLAEVIEAAPLRA